MKKNDTTAPASFSFYDGIALMVEEDLSTLEEVGMAPEWVEEVKRDYVYAIYRYGCWNEEPDFSRFDPIARTAVRMSFRALRYSIDKSRKNIADGKRGGRPKKKQEPDQVPEKTESYSSDLGWDSVSIARELA